MPGGADAVIAPVQPLVDLHATTLTSSGSLRDMLGEPPSIGIARHSRRGSREREPRREGASSGRWWVLLAA